MKTAIILMALLASVSTMAFEKEMCTDVPSYDKEECSKLVNENDFEKIPVELCQFRMSPGEMLECYEAIKNKTYIYDDVLTCAAMQRLSIPGCLEELGTPIN